jgi:hypothetical protein
MFRRAREAVRKAYRRLLDSIYRNIRGVEIRSVSCVIAAHMHDADYSFDPIVIEPPLALPEPVVHSDVIDCAVSSLTAVIETKLVEDSEPPVPDTVTVAVEVVFDESAVSDDEMAIEAPPVRAAETVVCHDLKLFAVSAVRPDTKLYNLKGLRGAEAVRVSDGQRWTSIIPMARRQIDFFKLPAEERVRLWSELVRQSGKRPKELELLGVFPGVPVKGIKRLGFESGSRSLRIWLEGVRKRGGEDTPTKTLILARERASGKLHRVFDTA